MDSVSEKGGKMVESDEQSERESGGGAAMAALHQCELIQNMIEISISSLQGLRTKCAASNDLTQQEIRTLEVLFFARIWKTKALVESVFEIHCSTEGPYR
ncbi:kinase suppressor of Ras 2-like [Oncorhynchus keta]|uniref:kinase suppressor of Ras 2-like n=1 Tax=Oncorhynchus keta TaxID=8018 RepID=UPI00227A6947|nr:kinase suppressor of Ras 2-like [Oncorhynchus keta]